MKKILKYTLLLLCPTTLLVSGCDTELSPVGDSKGSPAFTVTTTKTTTKSTIYNGTALPTSVSLGIIAYKYGSQSAAYSGWEQLSKGRSSLVVEARHDARSSSPGGSAKWVPVAADTLLWPGTGYVRFFAYAPYGASGVVVNAATAAAAPSIEYTVPDNVAEQNDILVSSGTNEYYGDPGWRDIDVPITLGHVLTGVRFRIVDGLKIHSVKVKGVKYKGSLPLDNPVSWETTDELVATPYTLTESSADAGLALVADSSKPGYNKTRDSDIMILMPQTLGAAAEIEVVVSERGTSRTITGYIEGQVWEPGKLVTYTVTSKSNPLLLLDASLEFDDIDWLNDVGVAAWDDILWNRQRILAPDIERIHWD